MFKLNTKPLLAAAVIGSAATFAVAQQDADVRVQRHGDDSVTVSIDQAPAEGAHAVRGKTIAGMIISLETYLRDGASAARNEPIASSGVGPKALLTDGGDLYVILDTPRYGEEHAALHDDRLELQHGTAATIDADDRSTRAITSVDADRDRLNVDVDTRPRRDVNVGTDAERNAREVLNTDIDMNASRNRTDEDDRLTRVEIDDDGDVDTQVYGMADPDRLDEHGRKHREHGWSHLKIGQEVTLVGDVYERGGMRGVAVDEVRVP